MDTSVSPATPGEEVWTYIGVRYYWQEKKLWYAYLDEQGEERIYKKQIGGSQVGARYRLQVTRKDGAVSVALHHYTYEGDSHDPRMPEWVIRHNADRALYDTIKVDQKAKNKLDDMTLNELAGHLNKMPTPRRRALLALILDRLLKGRGIVD